MQWWSFVSIIVYRPSDDIAALVKQGDISAFTLVQANILVDQAPTDEDVRARVFPCSTSDLDTLNFHVQLNCASFE